jgi:hypothetical protein
LRTRVISLTGASLTGAGAAGGGERSDRRRQAAERCRW